VSVRSIQELIASLVAGRKRALTCDGSTSKTRNVIRSPMNMPHILHIHIFTYIYVLLPFADDVKVPTAQPAVLASDHARIASGSVTHSKDETDSKHHLRCDETGLSYASCCPSYHMLERWKSVRILSAGTRPLATFGLAHSR
jgi:hypothetical protein